MREDPDFNTLQTIQKLYAEDSRRQRKSASLETRTISCGDKLENLALPGTLVVVLTRVGCKFLSELRESLNVDLRRAESLMFGMKARLARRASMPFAAAVDKMIELNSLVDIRHGGRTIATNVPVVSETEATIFTFPYLGGPLAQEGLRLIVKYQSEPDVDGIAILRPPTFSAAEASAATLLGDDERELEIGAPSMCWAASAATMAMTVAAVTVAASAVLPDEDSVVCDESNDVSSLDSLIQKRRQALRS